MVLSGCWLFVRCPFTHWKLSVPWCVFRSCCKGFTRSRLRTSFPSAFFHPLRSHPFAHFVATLMTNWESICIVRLPVGCAVSMLISPSSSALWFVPVLYPLLNHAPSSLAHAHPIAPPGFFKQDPSHAIKMFFIILYDIARWYNCCMGVNKIFVTCWPQWMKDEFSVNTLFDVVGSYGLDVPPVGVGDGLWVPQETAALFKYSGLNMFLQSAQPYWLSTLPFDVVRRKIFTAPVEVMLDRVVLGNVFDGFDVEGEYFWKMAEAKNDSFPAELRTVRKFVDDCVVQGFPDGSVLQVSERIRVDREFRVYVIDGVPRAACMYLQDGVTYYDGLVSDVEDERNVLLWLGEVLVDVPQPDSFVVDVGENEDGFFVLESNPAWCSAWYGCDIDVVAEAVYRSSSGGSYSQWVWVPDPYIWGKTVVKRKLVCDVC